MKDIHYYSNYAESHDIDCFFKVGDKAFHFASNGQPIPDFILRNKNIEIQNAVYERLEYAQGKVNVHKEVVEILIKRGLEGFENAKNVLADWRDDISRMVKEYTESFVEMARLGFISMDMDESGRFRVIAEPKGNSKVPDDILGLLPEGRIDNIL